MAELQRLLLSPKRIIILLMIAVINLAMFSGYCRADREEALAYYNSMRMFGVNVQNEAHSKTKQYLEQDYSAYLEYVQGQSQSQSILGKLTKKNSYVDRNSAKTGRDYKRLTGLMLEDGENRGINAVKDYAITDYLLLIAPLLLILELLADADTAAGDLVRATRNGRVQLCTWRILAVLLLSAASVLLLYGGNILFTCKFYGAPGFFPVSSARRLDNFCTLARQLLAAAPVHCSDIGHQLSQIPECFCSARCGHLLHAILQSQFLRQAGRISRRGAAVLRHSAARGNRAVPYADRLCISEEGRCAHGIRQGSVRAVPHAASAGAFALRM